ncbi:MAG: O-antigen ligase family protein [Terriglobales bacterium]
MSSAAATVAVQPEPAPVVKHAKPRFTNNVLLGASGVVLLFAPLAFGAVEPWTIFALEAAAMALVVAWAARQWINHQLEITGNALFFPMAAFLALAVVQWITGTSAYRHVTYTHILLYAAYGMIAFVITQSLHRSTQFEEMANVITAYGAIVAGLAILQGIAPNGKLLWIWPSAQGGWIYGSYVNHNHYAGLMELLTPFPIVLAVSRFTDGNRRLIVAAIAALMAGSIFLCGSRGGMLAFCVQMIVLAVLLLRSRQGNWKNAMVLGGILLVVIGFLVWLGGNEVTHRLVSIHTEAREEVTGGMRMSIDRDGLRMLFKRPILGWGLGTFPTVYPPFRSFYTTFFVNQAHNDYLQLLVETGLAGFLIAAWFLTLLFRKAASKLKNWTETATGALTASALLGVVGILVHSALDFNLQIPANAAIFYVFCAIAAGAPLQESNRKRVLRRRHHALIMEPIVQTQPSSVPSPQ